MKKLYCALMCEKFAVCPLKYYFRPKCFHYGVCEIPRGFTWMKKRGEKKVD